MPKRHELTESVWDGIAPLLPPDPRRGEKWRDHRTVINGILWKLTTGAPWRDLPARYGPWQTCHSRFLRWRRDGTWARLVRHTRGFGEGAWETEITSAVIHAQQRAAPGRRSA